MSETIGQERSPIQARRLLPTDSELNRMMRISKNVARGGISGVNTPQEALTRILAGWSCGIDVATALVNVKPVEGRLAVPEMVAVAAIRRSGLGDIRTVEVCDDHATVRVTRADWPSELHPAAFEDVSHTDADAIREGLLVVDAKGNNISKKNNWKFNKPWMHLARARGNAKRKWLEETVGGLPYSPDELGADTDEDGNEVVADFDEPRTSWTPPAATATPTPDAVPATPTVVPPVEPAKPVPSWFQPPVNVAALMHEQSLEPDPVRQALNEVFQPATTEQQAEAKRLFKALELDAVTWAVVIARERAGAKSIKELTSDRAGELLARLEKVRKLRLLREASNLSDESWSNALKKRAVTKDVLLPAAAVDEIFAKLYDAVAPFKRQEIGVDPVPQDSTAGKALPSPAASQELQSAAA
jgi:hypothetical protein